MLVRIDTKVFRLEQLHDMIACNDVILRKSIQSEIKSGLIESILIGVPFPSLYFIQRQDGSFEIVRGEAVLAVVDSFMKNEFKLKGLNYFSDCNGMSFSDLNCKYKRLLNLTTLTVHIIDAGVSEDIKPNICEMIDMLLKEMCV